jgi:hypothetical protein
LDSCAVNAVAVPNVTDALPEGPTELDRVSAFKAAVTCPMASVLTCAVIVSEDVPIATPRLLTPAVSFAVDAGVAAKVSPLHVTVTKPAGTATLTSMTSRLSDVILLASVDERVIGFGTISQLFVAATAVTKPDGNVRLIFPSTASGVDVWKANVAVCEAPTPLDMVAIGREARELQVAAKGDDAALKPCWVISIDLKAFATPDNGVKV